MQSTIWNKLTSREPEPEPCAQPAAGPGLRILRDSDDLEQALDRAAASEHRSRRQVQRRYSHYSDRPAPAPGQRRGHAGKTARIVVIPTALPPDPGEPGEPGVA